MINMFLRSLSLSSIVVLSSSRHKGRRGGLSVFHCNDCRKPLCGVAVDAFYYVVFQPLEESQHQFEIIVVAVARREQQLEMPLDVVELKLGVVVVGLYQIADYLMGAERHERFLGEVALVDEGVEDGEEKLGVEPVIAAHGLDRAVASAEIYSESVDYGNHRRLIVDYIAEFSVGIYQCHFVQPLCLLRDLMFVMRESVITMSIVMSWGSLSISSTSWKS